MMEAEIQEIHFYNGYTGEANGSHKPLLLNAVIWLALSSNLNIPNVSTLEFIFYPNPSSDFLYFKGYTGKNIEYSIIDASERMISKSVTN
ncbi:hypothetical protein [Kaistella jeonii]|uniref:hypothetical protein n=1 Tax=Kaistella jeonii TaxID=266749 RepID=UPI0008F2BD37|nr:hypothetical protein [Kaistella jeonii]SFC04436.1 hypothetical protein SAMN05421876_105188 [Kaistella jeonii]VEI96718.1 Uncharacterised protein [Kaistella jeonii]